MPEFTLRFCCVVVACSALASCARDSPPQQREPGTLRLADQVVAAAGAPNRTEAVGGIGRTVLPGTFSEVLQKPTGPRHVEQRGDGTEASFRCPAPLAGRVAALAVISSAGMMTQAVRCPDDPEAPLQVRIPARPDPGTATWVLRGVETDQVKTPTVTLERGAQLHVALGLAPAFSRTQIGPAGFRVTAADAAGRTAVVLERRLDPGTSADDAGWVQVDADLDTVRRSIGPDVNFVFEAQTEDRDAATTLPVWGDPTIIWPGTTETPVPRWNVVLVSLDTLRADRLSLYGARRPTSPTLDAFAAESTVFETAIAPAPWTLPSHVSMMTGLNACAHGIVGPGIGAPLPPGVSPLAERLRKAGFDTAAFTEDGLVDPAALNRGFGCYWENRDGEDRVRVTMAHAQHWVREEARQPFFLFVHTYQTHDPYFAPPEYTGMVDPKGEAATLSSSQQALIKYEAAIRYTDAALAPLIAALREAPRGGHTLLVVTSDHGEAFSEHGYVGHGRTLHEELLHVPLLVWGPGLVAAGRRVFGQVGVIDVTPTILDLLGLPVPDGITGVSLASQLRSGESVPPVPERTLFSENSLHDVYRLTARGPRWKAMWDGPDLAIFDIPSDGMERVSATTPGLAGEAAKLRAWFEEECARQRAKIDASGGRASAPASLPDPDRERRLRALGYVQ